MNETGGWLARETDGRVIEVDAGGYPGGEASPDDGRPAVEPWEPRRVVELADHRVWYASQQENTGSAGLRAELVASRATRAMSGHRRYGSPREADREAEAG